MKRINTICVIAALLLAINQLMAQNVIHSTLNGGYWTDPATWMEGVPSSLDSVVIQGPVSMLSYTGYCTSLNILPTGSLGGGGNQGTMFVSGSIYNSGTILGTINYTLAGNIMNYQSWTGDYSVVKFTGTDHYIYCTNGAIINAQLQAEDSLQNLILQSDVILSCPQTSALGNSEIEAGDYKLTIEGSGFHSCRLHSSDTLQLSCVLSDMTISGNYKLNGNLVCAHNVVLEGVATNIGSIQFASGIGGVPIIVKADLTNEGNMTHSWVQIYKSVINNGIWNVERTEFDGPGIMYISQAEGHPFLGNQFLSNNSGLQIRLLSDVELAVTSCNLGLSDTLDCGAFQLTSNTSFYSGTIKSNSRLTGTSKYWGVNIFGDLIIDGVHRFSNSTFNGLIQNEGELKEITFYGGVFNCYGHLTNMDTIDGLNMNVYGNLTNRGKIYNNAIVNVTGNVRQYILLTSAIETMTRFYSDVSGSQYQWMKDGTDIPNQFSVYMNFSTLQLEDAGIYQCRVTTESGIVYSREIVVNNTTSLPETVESFDNLKAYPNPFKYATTIAYELKNAARIRISIHDGHGTELVILTDSIQETGTHELILDATRFPKGIIILRMEVIIGGKKQVKLLKLNHV
ncbi:MAG: hypothetical protein IPH88_06430 [Bacteroidales bacterium]|nr:hypothetical protein [Bacteroidales bacterium]